MEDVNDKAVQARLIVYRLPQLRTVQVLTPVALMSTILVRRVPGPLSTCVAVIVLFGAAWALSKAIKRAGVHNVTVEKGAVQVGSMVSVARARVLRWTFMKRAATLYCRDTTYKLRATKGYELRLEQTLRELLGNPTMLRRRGSLRARGIAVSVSLLGLMLTVSAFLSDTVPLVVLGVPCLIFGGAAFGALSQRTV